MPREKERDRQTDEGERKRGRETDRQTDRDRERQTDRDRDREREREKETDRQTEIKGYTNMLHAAVFHIDFLSVSLAESALTAERMTPPNTHILQNLSLKSLKRVLELSIFWGRILVFSTL